MNQKMPDLRTVTPEQWNQYLQQQVRTAYDMAGPMSMSVQPLKLDKNFYKVLKLVSDKDRKIMGDFVTAIEQGGARKALGNVGYGAQKIAQGMGLEPTISNPALAKKFNQIVEMLDRLGIKPIVER